MYHFMALYVCFADVNQDFVTMTGSLLRVTAGTYYGVWYVGYWRVLCVLQYVLGRGRAITKTRGLLVSSPPFVR